MENKNNGLKKIAFAVLMQCLYLLQYCILGLLCELVILTFEVLLSNFSFLTPVTTTGEDICLVMPMALDKCRRTCE